ncbi:hypothetical protein [Plantactinospora endophytica]|uniref:DUF4386 domain-containing protein n=1 Tax=Plantactinospora endophytica TaxID=673535 RepID=A0ABQ4E0M5_9ACTN|nr:hypothetical protein [Plantactinospora endophytica]GIG87887.1 hypothetical protein Pen02_28230 [Plantactinospora endophytica]
MMFLILGPALNLAAGFFWLDDTQGATSGALTALGIACWLIGLLALNEQLRPRAPRYAAIALPLTVFGATGGLAFSIQSIHEEMFGISHATAVERLNEFPLAANALYWTCGPLFPLVLVALGVTLLRLRAAPVAIGVLVVLGGLAFPVSRITREASIAHVADLLLLLPFLYLGIRSLRQTVHQPAQAAATLK